MVSEDDKEIYYKLPDVLILVLMADGLWVTSLSSFSAWFSGLNPCSNGRWSLSWSILIEWLLSIVLILVLMADGLWGPAILPMRTTLLRVLILVLMADGLWAYNSSVDGAQPLRLNPCSNGRWSLSLTWAVSSRLTSRSLNPCSNGRWSLSSDQAAADTSIHRGLNPCSNGRWSLRGSS